MKTFLLIILSFFPALAAFAEGASDKAPIKVLVYQWNELHNTKNINGFYEIYDPSVLFYGTQSSRLTCVWRKELFQNKIQLAKNYQLKNYKTFEKKEKKKVFIVLGLGGEPSDPENIYIIPIKNLYKPELGQYQLQQYRKMNRNTFFYNPFAFELE